ncbi:MAG: DUF488 family protein [Stellaceae bacterium]
MALYTAGYEGLRIEDFIYRLRAAGIELVVDVRALPLSRKPGFSKRAFERALAEAGIGYAHRQALGTPKPIRARYKRDHDVAALNRDFGAYLEHQDLALAELTDLIHDKTACLVCYEADPKLCHRSLVAAAARRFGAPDAIHLDAR